MTDCVVVGGGIIGMLSARELALGGMSVTVLERGMTGRESSWAGGGILSPLYPWRYPDAVTALAQWGQQRYSAVAQSLLTRSGIDPEWQQSGMLILDCAERDGATAWANRTGATIELIDRDAVAQCEPSVMARHDAALWMPEVAQVRNPRLLQALRSTLEKLGVAFREQCEVTDLQQLNGTISGVQTTQGVVNAASVVVAGGAWSQALLRESAPLIDVQPVRGQMLLYKGSPGMLKRMVMGEGHYVIPRKDGHVLVGSTVEYVGFDKSTTESAAVELRQVAEMLVPALSGLPVVKHWAGLRPGSPEGVPYIGEHPEISGLFLNTGHFRNGVVLGLGSARLLSDLLLGRGSDFDRSLYAVER